MSDNNYGVLLFESEWQELEKALEPYVRNGPIGKYIYCRRLEYIDQLVELTITPEQVGNRIVDEVTISIPTSFVKFIATVTESNQSKLGFVSKRECEG